MRSIKDRIAAVGGSFRGVLLRRLQGRRRAEARQHPLQGLRPVRLDGLQEDSAPAKKDAQRQERQSGYYVDAVKIDGFEQQNTKGGTTFRVPKFGLVPLSEESNKQAIALDAELQAFLADYLKRPRIEAAAATVAEKRQRNPRRGNNRFSDMEDDIPPARDES
jgi:hypothetical protein